MDKRLQKGLILAGVAVTALSLVFLVSLFQNKQNKDELGFSVVTGYRSTVRASMNASQDFIRVSSLTLRDSTVLDMSLLGERVFLTLAPGTVREEIVMCTGVNTSTVSFTDCTRGLSFSGASYTSVPDNRNTHNAGTVVTISNVHYVYEQLVDKDADETVGGIKTFSSIPRTATTTPTLDEQIATKKYVDDTALASAPDATLTVKGVSELATGAEAAATAAAGSGNTSGALVLHTGISTSTGGIMGNWVPMSNASGYINATFGGVANSFATLNANSLVVQNPASATSTPTADSIVISGGDNYINQGFLPNPFVVSSTYSIVDTSNNPIVGNTILFVTTTDFTLGNSGTELNFVTTTIPANTLGTKGGLKITVSVDSTSNISASGSCEFRVRYGGTLFTTIQLPKVVSIVNMSSDIYLLSNNSTSSQIGFAFPSLRTGDAGSNQILLTSAEGTASIDSTQEQPLVFSYVRTGDTTGCTSITLQRVLVTRIF